MVLSSRTGYQPWLWISAVFALGLLPRLTAPAQPLLEGFIDRQVHTAMIARNLLRDGDLLRPHVDIGPFPAYYMLEFPGYPAIVASLVGIFDLDFDLAGRLVSILAVALSCVVLFDLVRRTDGAPTALLAVLCFSFMPVTVRYGRAFQPDATMLLLILTGIWSCQRWSAGAGRGWLFLSSTLVACGLLLKVIAAYVMIPLAYLVWRREGRLMWRRWSTWLVILIAVLPSLAWYFHAYQTAAGETTVSTPFWQFDKWIKPSVLLSSNTYRQLAFFLGWRCLTPVGILLLLIGVLVKTEGPRVNLISIWLISLGFYFPILARKLDHEHYYLALAPVCAIYMARAVVWLWRTPLESELWVSGKVAAGLLCVALLGIDLLASRSTFRAPAEWAEVTVAGNRIRERIPDSALTVGHSAVLYYADRRGFPMAYQNHEVEYLFRNFGRTPRSTRPIDLLELYRGLGAGYFVELLGTGRESENEAFFVELRSRYATVEERPGKFIIVDLKSRPARARHESYQEHAQQPSQEEATR